MNGHAAEQVKRSLRQWIAEHAQRQPVDGQLRDDTPILEQRVISSLQVMELILFVEKSCGRAIDIAQLRPAAFRSVDDIYRTFFSEASNGQPA